jgi:error-prone DNA polymerase
LSLDDFVRRTGLDTDVLTSLAEAGAFACFDVSRRQALWEVTGLCLARNDTLPIPSKQAPPTFNALSDFETVAWDYTTSSHSTHGHPLGPLRPQLSKLGLLSAEDLTSQKDNHRIRYAGLVICRQRPSTAGGVTFMTLEDETGFANLVIWKNIFEAHKVLAKTASLLGVEGKVQSKDGVVHLIAERLFVPNIRLDSVKVESRDFR